VQTRWDYFLELQNWNELLLFPLAILFVFVFANDCGCPASWQWQVGIFTLFLAWMNLLFICAEFPKTGTYVIVFKRILVTFLKLSFFSLILLIGFALILIMMFYNPRSEVCVEQGWALTLIGGILCPQAIYIMKCGDLLS
jgi:hypothetical protein